MNYKITINCQGGRQNHIGNPLVKLDECEYATREEACEAIYSALEGVIQGDGCEMVKMADYMHHDHGMLFWCDSNGNSCEPLNADDEPYTIDDADMCDTGDCALILRRSTIDDDCDARITHVATDQYGDIKSYLRWLEYDEYAYPVDEYCSACHDYILREGYASEDGVTATVEEIVGRSEG